MTDEFVAAWIPSEEVLANANVTEVGHELGLADYDALYRWSIEDRERFWAYMMERLSIKVGTRGERLLDVGSPTRPVWLPGARLNIVESCLQADSSAAAIVYSDGVGPLATTTYGELKAEAARIANSLTARGIKSGDRIGVILPMTPTAVAVYLGVIAAGAAVICIPDSFASDEIATRLRIADAVLVITQDVIPRGSKLLPLYERVAASEGTPAALVIAHHEPVSVKLRESDLEWPGFLGSDTTFAPVMRGPQDPVSILFSSGTTGDPKAIPWDHTTPIKCAADGHLHQDIHEGDVVCWPTSLGWMMGPWLVFAALINKATVALYGQSPVEAEFGRLVQDARVTMLGLVPSMVKSWRLSGCMEAFDWSGIKSFSSSGECSNASDMLYLMSLAGNKPVIEYCGGTEIGGAYVTGVVVKPCIPATFNTPALGIDFELLDEEHTPQQTGEVFIKGPSIGLSTWLLNRDHEEVYFSGSGVDDKGTPRRKHGDELLSLSGGYYQMLGRCDDTMNLGGIKVGCAEIERVVGPIDGVAETAAVAVSESGGGPSRLVIFAVLQPGVQVSAESLKELMQARIKDMLNPLFRVSEVCLVESLPRTASNKIMRRHLRPAVQRSGGSV